MLVLPAIPEAILKASRVIKNGGVVAFPTETVYGLGTDAFNAYAVARIFEVKNRPHFDPIIVHICDLAQLKLLVKKIPPQAEKLIKQFWPGPLTLVLEKTDRVPKIITAGLSTVAVRMPANQIAQELIKKSGVPIAAPSANKFGCLSPTTAEHVKKQLGDKIEMILDGGKCQFGIESTVIYFDNENPTILRHGALPQEDIEKVIGKVKTLKKFRPGLSPGTLPKHYAPQTPIKIIGPKTKIDKEKKIGLLAFMPPKNTEGFCAVEILSARGDYLEAAANFFAALHRLDEMNLDLIYAERIKEIGLGRAIMERLKKASYKEK
jgi:L-threonylcarbamoyladenylate synthase